MRIYVFKNPQRTMCKYDTRIYNHRDVQILPLSVTACTLQYMYVNVYVLYVSPVVNW